MELGSISTLKMEALCSSETSVAIQQTTRRHIPKDDTLQGKTYFEIKVNVRITALKECVYIYKPT
jgi:hypothetical protein